MLFVLYWYMIKKWAVIMAAVVALAACSDGRGGAVPTPLTPRRATDPRPAPFEAAAVQPTLRPAWGVWKDTGISEDQAYMNSVAAPGSRDAWAVGSDAFNLVGIVKHWDGRRWRPVKPPRKKKGNNGLLVVSASTSGNVWVFGEEGDAWRREGGGWSHQGRPSQIDSLHAAVVVSPREVWVAGAMSWGNWSPVVARWSGASWTTVPTPFEGAVTSLSVGSGRQLWAIGREGDPRSGEGAPAVARWDGERWRAVPLPDLLRSKGVRLKRIVAASPGKAWIAGSVDTGAVQVRDDEEYTPGFVMYWNGHNWQSLNAPSHDAFLSGTPGVDDFGTIASDGRGGLWLGDAHARIWHYDGRAWAAEKTVSGNKWYMADGFASIPGSRRAIAVGGKPMAEEDSRGWIWMRHPVASE
ncbi:hypothetical protein GCM10023334_076270 [Nonomuraea thailandensis]